MLSSDGGVLAIRLTALHERLPIEERLQRRLVWRDHLVVCRGHQLKVIGRTSAAVELFLRRARVNPEPLEVLLRWRRWRRRQRPAVSGKNRSGIQIPIKTF